MSINDLILKGLYSYFKENVFVPIITMIKLDDIIRFITFDVMESIEKYLTNEKLFEGGFNPNCTTLLKTVFFSKSLLPTYFYFKKITIDSTKNKNDFLTYENCLNNKNFPEFEKENFTVKPVFIVGTVDDSINKVKLKASILQEKYNYLTSFCLPYGAYKEGPEESKAMCKKNDYDKIIKTIMKISFNMSTANVNTYQITEL